MGSYDVCCSIAGCSEWERQQHFPSEIKHINKSVFMNMFQATYQQSTMVLNVMYQDSCKGEDVGTIECVVGRRYGWFLVLSSNHPV